jgi:hypothetical protein
MAEMMPPAGAPKGMAPAPGSADSAAMRERAANAMMDKERARYEAMAAAAPKPTKPYSAKTVQTLIDTFNETIDKLGGQDLPAVEVELGGAERWTEPLPATIFVPLMALFQAAQQVGGGKFAGKYSVEPGELIDDNGLRMAAGELVRMGNDAMLAKAMQAPINAPGQAGGEMEGAPAPKAGAMTRAEMGAEDKALMESM